MSSSIKINGVTLTTGNSKLGKVLNVSLPPRVSCDTSMPCYKDGCYAIKSAYRLYKNVRDAWDGNWKAYRRDWGGYFNAIHTAIVKAKPELFRWHVGGDIPDADYLRGMLIVASAFPDVKFRAFTKRYDLAREARKDILKRENLTVSLSMWPGVYVHPSTIKAWSVSWLDDPKNPDPHIPADAIPCSGRCDKCQVCWGLQPGQSVVLHKH